MDCVARLLNNNKLDSGAWGSMSSVLGIYPSLLALKKILPGMYGHFGFRQLMVEYLYGESLCNEPSTPTNNNANVVHANPTSFYKLSFYTSKRHGRPLFSRREKNLATIEKNDQEEAKENICGYAYTIV